MYKLATLAVNVKREREQNLLRHLYSRNTYSVGKALPASSHYWVQELDCLTIGVSIDSGLTCNRRVNDIIRACIATTWWRCLISVRPSTRKSDWTGHYSLTRRLLQHPTIRDIGNKRCLATAPPEPSRAGGDATSLSLTRVRCTDRNALASGSRAHRLQTRHPDSLSAQNSSANLPSQAPRWQSSSTSATISIRHHAIGRSTDPQQETDTCLQLVGTGGVELTA